MTRLMYIALPLLFLVLAPSFLSAANPGSTGEVTLVVPETRIKKIVSQLMPYRINLGKDFSGTFWLKSVENISIGRNTVSFKTHIYGEDINYLPRIGSQTVQIELGSVNSYNNWTVSLRYEGKRGRLFLRPHVEGAENRDSLGRGDFLLDSLLLALGDIEYPVNVDKIKPLIIKTLFDSLQININISNIYTERGNSFVEIVPSIIKKEL